jgi:hypothetical protein
MCNLHWLIVYQPFSLLTYGCQKEHDVFDVVNFISNDWEAKHVTIKLFKVLNTSGVTMAPKL